MAGWKKYVMTNMYMMLGLRYVTKLYLSYAPPPNIIIVNE